MVIISAMSEAEMVVKLMNPDGEMEKAVKFSTEPRFKPKSGSVIPAKRRSVKRMMFDCLAQSIPHFVRPRRPPSSSAATQSDKPISCLKMSKPIYPQTP